MRGSDMVCWKCGSNCAEIDGYLERANPVGVVPALWRCVPNCDPLGLCGPAPAASPPPGTEENDG